MSQNPPRPLDPVLTVSTEAGSELAFTVVVAAYNTGEALHELVRSLDAQTLPQDRFEVVVVDDGSTDGTSAVLDEVAATRPNWLVRHIPNSGWPGAPRNLGIDLARGEFVTFLDHDDYLGPRALESVSDFAARHRSDVVVAREVGVGRSIGRSMFARTIPDATFENSPIIRLLTPHKVYRRRLLVDHGIRFLEGKVRLEDHLFTMAAYFAARKVSVFADQPFYYWTLREGAAHASMGLKEPHEYIEVAINRVLDLVEANIEPGPRRDLVKSHWLERKLLPIVSCAPMLEYPADYREDMVAAIRELVEQRYPLAADALLPFSGRVRAHLVRAGAVEPLMALARTEQDITTRVVATGWTWDADGAQVQLRIDLQHKDGSPVEFRRDDGRLTWEPREPLADLDVDVDVTAELDRAVALLVVQRRDGADDFVADVVGAVEQIGLEAPGRVSLSFVGTAQVPTDRVLALREGAQGVVVDLRAEFEVLGWKALRRVTADPDLPLPSPCPERPDELRAYRTQQDNLSLQVGASRPAGRLRKEVSPSAATGWHASPDRRRAGVRRIARRILRRAVRGSVVRRRSR